MAGPGQADILRLARMLMGGGQQTPEAMQQPYAGLHNTPGLPPFEAPGLSLSMERYMPPQTVAASPMPSPVQNAVEQAPPVMQPMPAPVSVQDDVVRAAKALMAQGKLPEQWKGAFTPQYGEPL